MYEKTEAYAIKHNLWCKWDATNNKWQRCFKNAKGAKPDLNTATEQMYKRT